MVLDDVSGDFAGKIGLRCKDSTGDKNALDIREPDFNLLELQGTNLLAVNYRIGMSGEQVPHSSGLMVEESVGNGVDDISLGLFGDDICEEGNETGTDLVLGSFGELAAVHVQGGVDGECALPEVFETWALGRPGNKYRTGLGQSRAWMAVLSLTRNASA